MRPDVVASGPNAATVTVRGEAVIRSEPDEALLWITLSAFEDSPGKALGDVAQRSDKLVALLDELQVAEADRSTAGVSVEEEFDPPSRTGRGLGHRAMARVAVRLADPEVIGRAISRASEELRASVDGPHWYISLANPVRFEAAKQAVIDATRKALACAEGAGARLGPAIRIWEPGTGAGPPGVIRRLSSESGGMSIETEQLEVRAELDVTFELEVAQPRR